MRLGTIWGWLKIYNTPSSSGVNRIYIQNGKKEVDMFLPIAAIALISLISESDIIG